MSKPTKDDILENLLEFFFEEFDNDPKSVGDWLAQGDWDADRFFEAARKLQAELKLR